MNVLDVRDLAVHHRDEPDRRITTDVTFAVASGESLAIVGESGSGKSLTARAVLGLLPPNLEASGAVELAGTRTDARPDRTAPLRGDTVALLVQDPFTMLHPLRRIGTQLGDGLGGRGSRRQGEQLVLDRLAEVGLDADVARRYPHQLSGGMRQRVGIAAALLRDPDLLIADEPTTALDATTQRDIMRLLFELRERRHLALVLITHDLGLAFATSDRALVLYAGAPVEHAAASPLRRRPQHPYTAALLAAEPTVEHRLAHLGGIEGNVPALAEVQGRCAFADRCPHVVDICRERRPPLSEQTPGHAVACWRASELDLTRGARPIVVDPDAKEASGDTALVLASHVTHTFAGTDRPALDDVTIAIGAGRAVSIVGESGSGKTTLARIMVGLLRADEAQLTIDGSTFHDWSSVRGDERHRLRRSIQMVFQDPYSSLNPRWRVRATLNEALRAFDSHPSNTVEDLLDLVHLPRNVATVTPGSLSGGERQRVAIARALATRPKVIIFDEAVSALDVSVQAQILDLLNELRVTAGLAIVLITHDLAVARQTTDVTYVLRRGKVVESGPTARVLAQPNSDYTRRLLASVPDIDGSWLVD